MSGWHAVVTLWTELQSRILPIVVIVFTQLYCDLSNRCWKRAGQIMLLNSILSLFKWTQPCGPILVRTIHLCHQSHHHRRLLSRSERMLVFWPTFNAKHLFLLLADKSAHFVSFPIPNRRKMGWSVFVAVNYSTQPWRQCSFLALWLILIRRMIVIIEVGRIKWKRITH